MRISLFSDLHTVQPEYLDRIVESVKAQEPDVIVNAGDNSNMYFADFTEKLTAKMESIGTYISVMGNHDYYMNDEHPSNSKLKTVQVNDVIFYADTLWTNFFEDNTEAFFSARSMNDYRFIDRWNTTACYNLHHLQLERLKSALDKDPDAKKIIVTHHGPSKMCINEKFFRSNINGSFVNDLDNFILDQKNLTYWMHGHVHDPVDVMIGETRVLCNPKGYPHEGRCHTYEPLLIEI